MRELLGQWIADKAEKNPEFQMLSGDHGYALFDPIRKKSPHQFLNVGVMEQAMVGIAAGLAKTGYRPWVYGLSAFVPIRVLEQIKLDVCYSNLPVVFIGDGAGLVYSTLGASHQCGEDIACLRSIPNMTILSPADASELQPTLEYAWSLKSPVYIRIGKSDRQALQEEPRNDTNPYFTYKADSKKIAQSSPALTSTVLIGHGSMTGIAKEIALKLGCDSYSIPLIHPFPAQALKDLESYAKLIFIEEHSRYGGLTSAYTDAALLNKTLIHQKIQALTLKPKFSEFCGSHQYALSEHELSDSQIINRVRSLIDPQPL